MPALPKVTAENLRSEEKGSRAVAASTGLRGLPKYFFSALLVILSPFKAEFMEDTISFTVKVVEPPRRSILSLTRMLPSVIVPVLSRHSVSTRASISMQYSSCTTVFLFARRKKEAASATLVSRKGPAGIMEIMEPASC